jgi:hypothetical protein
MSKHENAVHHSKCARTHTHTYTHTCIHTYMSKYINAGSCFSKSMYITTYIHTYMSKIYKYRFIVQQNYVCYSASSHIGGQRKRADTLIRDNVDTCRRCVHVCISFYVCIITQPLSFDMIWICAEGMYMYLHMQKCPEIYVHHTYNSDEIENISRPYQILGTWTLVSHT